MISIVIPVYNSARCLEELTQRLETTLTDLGGNYELIFVDDGSADDSWQELRRLAASRDSRMKVARSAVNRGQHNAILCGFSLAGGDVVVTLDDDLQHPPEEIPRLLETLGQGYDLVIGAYADKRHSRSRNLGGAVVDGIQRRIFSLPKGFQLTSFRAVRRSVVEHALQMAGAYPFVSAMLLTNSARRANVAVEHHERTAGSSSYTLLGGLRLALNLLLGYSSYPVVFVAALCGLGFLFSSSLAFVTFWRAWSVGTGVPGWASTVVILTFFNSLMLLCLLIFGLYLSRISRQLAGTRSSFRIDEVF